MSRAKAWLLAACVAMIVVAAFFAGRLVEALSDDAINSAEYALEATSLPGDYAPSYWLRGSAGLREFMTQTAFVIQYPSDREALLREISRTDGWHVAQVSAQEYRDFADVALWTQAKVLQVRDDTCFDAWYYCETAEPVQPSTLLEVVLNSQKPALPDGPLSEIGELGRGFHFAVYDAESGLFVYVNQFG